MPSITYAVVPTRGVTATQAAQDQAMLTQVLDLTGGADTSDLPAGFVPLPSSLYQEAQADIAVTSQTRGAGYYIRFVIRFVIRFLGRRNVGRRHIGWRFVRIVGCANHIGRVDFCVREFDAPDQRAGATDGARCSDQREQRGGRSGAARDGRSERFVPQIWKSRDAQYPVVGCQQQRDPRASHIAPRVPRLSP